jgi:hypothetical protein
MIGGVAVYVNAQRQAPHDECSPLSRLAMDAALEAFDETVLHQDPPSQKLEITDFRTLNKK